VAIPTAAFAAYSSALVLGPILGPAVGAVNAAAATALGFAKLKMINETPLPSYAVGSWAVPYDMKAQIHQGEMIVPKTMADSVRSGEATVGAGGGGNTIIVQGSLIDREGFLSAMNDANMEIKRRTGVDSYSRKSVY